VEFPAGRCDVSRTRELSPLLLCTSHLGMLLESSCRASRAGKFRPNFRCHESQPRNSRLRSSRLSLAKRQFRNIVRSICSRPSALLDDRSLPSTNYLVHIFIDTHADMYLFINIYPFAVKDHQNQEIRLCNWRYRMHSDSSYTFGVRIHFHFQNR